MRHNPKMTASELNALPTGSCVMNTRSGLHYALDRPEPYPTGFRYAFEADGRRRELKHTNLEVVP